MKKITAILVVLCVIGAYCAIYFLNIKNTELETQNTVTENVKKEIYITDETKEIINETIEAINNNEDLSTKEIPESTEEEEKAITDEGALETDAVVEQENISYNGDTAGSGLSLLGPYQGLTYYSQADSRWANVMYSSTGNTSQTMKTSACRADSSCNSCKF